MFSNDNIMKLEIELNKNRPTENKIMYVLSYSAVVESCKSLSIIPRLLLPRFVPQTTNRHNFLFLCSDWDNVYGGRNDEHSRDF